MDVWWTSQPLYVQAELQIFLCVLLLNSGSPILLVDTGKNIWSYPESLTFSVARILMTPFKNASRIWLLLNPCTASTQVQATSICHLNRCIHLPTVLGISTHNPPTVSMKSARGIMLWLPISYWDKGHFLPFLSLYLRNKNIHPYKSLYRNSHSSSKKWEQFKCSSTDRQMKHGLSIQWKIM